MKISYFDPLMRGWERMKDVLFRPFDLVTWLVLGFAAWLAGLGDGFGGGGSGTRYTVHDGDGFGSIGRGFGELGREIGENLVILPLVFLAILLIVAVILLILWVSSRAKLIFLDNVVTGQAAIIEPWKRFRTEGDSLFLWRAGFALAVILIAALIAAGLIVPAAAAGSFHGAAEGLSIAAMVVGVIGLVVVGVVAAYVALFLDAFIVPIMYRYRITAVAAWRAFLPWLQRYAGHFVVYGLFVLLLAVVFVAIATVACILTCCIVMIPYVGTVLLLPVWVTYRAFSVSFLAQLHPDFDLFALEAAASLEGAGETAPEGVGSDQGE